MFIIINTLIKPAKSKKIVVSLKKIYGIGSYRSNYAILVITGKTEFKIRIIKFIHFQSLNFIFNRKNFLLKEKFIFVSRTLC
jgi:ribosomal protein S13